MLKIIRKLLLEVIEKIDKGTSNLSEEEAINAISLLKNFTNKEKPLSKYSACEYLGISRSKFDTLVKEGKLPKGKKVIRFKELSWNESELKKYAKSVNK